MAIYQDEEQVNKAAWRGLGYRRDILCGSDRGSVLL